MNMEFLKMNYLNTTTQVTPSQGGTSTVSYLFDRKTDNTWGSGDASDATVTTIRITFEATLTVDRIILQSINLKSFRICYNSDTTTNLFSVSSALTNASSWVTNSETSLYLIVPTTSVKDLYITASTTISANEEKQIGELWVTQYQVRFEDNPATSGFKPVINRKDYTMEMSDGGTDIYVVQENYKATIDMPYMSATERSSFKDLYYMRDAFIFLPEPTGTAWGGEIYAVNWVNDFDMSWTRDFKGNGYNFKMSLMEIPK